MRSLHESPEEALTVQELTERMVQKNSNVTRIVDKLLAKGIVDRVPCSENRRKVEVSLTRRGRDQLKVLDQIVYDLHKKRIPIMDHTELADLNEILVKLGSSGNNSENIHTFLNSSG